MVSFFFWWIPENISGFQQVLIWILVKANLVLISVHERYNKMYYYISVVSEIQTKLLAIRLSHQLMLTLACSPTAN